MTDWLRFYHTIPAPLRSVVASLRGYYLGWWRYGSETPELIDRALARDSWSSAQWESWQQERLAYILDQAVKHVPYYRSYWAERRHNGDQRSHNYLENWPILKKEQLRQSPQLFLSDKCDAHRMFRDHTSGSTGTPVYTYLERNTLHEWYALFEARVRNWNNVSRQDRWAIMGGQLVVPFAQKKPPFWVYNAALNQLYFSTHHLSPTTAGIYIKKLYEFAPSHMIVYPSSGSVLASAILDLKLSPPPIKVIFSNAELLTNNQKEMIEKAFNCRVVNTYGMGEYLTGASECENDVLHLWPEVGYVEVFDDDVKIPVGSGTSGRFVITSLLNADMPLIRYDTGDRGQLDVAAQCKCGRQLPIVQSLEGRANDLLIAHDGRRVFWINPVFYGLPIREAQVIQESLSKIVIRYVPASEFCEQDARLMVERLQARLGSVSVVLEPVLQVPRESNGKFRAVVSSLHQ